MDNEEEGRSVAKRIKLSVDKKYEWIYDGLGNRKKGDHKMDKKTLVNYLSWARGWIIAAIVWFVLCGWSSIWATVESGEIMLVAIMLSPTVVPLLVAVIRRMHVQRYVDALEKNGELGMVLYDFQTSHPLVKDKVRLGARYVYGRGCRRAVSYSDITKVYQYTHSTYFIEDQRSLQYVNAKKRTKKLCSLQLNGKSDRDVAVIMGFIRQQNPSVHLGYK